MCGGEEEACVGVVAAWGEVELLVQQKVEGVGGRGRRGSEGLIECLRSSRGRRAGMELAGVGPGMREEANGVEPDTLDWSPAPVLFG